MTGTIFNIQRFSVNDGPGIRTTIFLKGCPLSCIWCHNPESQVRDREVMYWENRCLRCGACAEHCPQHAIRMEQTVVTDLNVCDRCGECLDHCFSEARDIVGQDMTVKDVIKEIDKDSVFYQESNGGITLSGGEPLMQADFSHLILKSCKSHGIHTALDTCGFAAWSQIDMCRPYVDLFLFDLKLMDDKRHRTYTGVSNELILENLKRLSQRQHNITIRIPIIPGITDDSDNIIAICEFVKKLSTRHDINLLPYHPIATEKYRRLQRVYDVTISPPKNETMQNIQRLVREFDLDVSIGG